MSGSGVSLIIVELLAH